MLNGVRTLEKVLKRFLHFNELIRSKNHANFFRRFSRTLDGCFNWQICFLFCENVVVQSRFVVFQKLVEKQPRKKNVQNILRRSEMVVSDKTKYLWESKIQFIEANKMIIQQLEYFFFFLNFDILLLKVILKASLLWELQHGVCMWECRDKSIKSTVMKVGSIWMLKK